MPHPTVADVVGLLEHHYPPAAAEPWDAVGLTCGDPSDVVRRVLLAVDPAAAVVDEAAGMGADLLVTHHPLLLRPVHSVAASDARGRVVHRLLRHGIALATAHTNADVAAPGVSDALAAALGLTDLVPLEPRPAPPRDKIVVFVPPADADRVLSAMADAGAGRIGAYDRCAFLGTGVGQFRPLAGARPHLGTVGAVEQVPEVRLEMVAPRTRRAEVLAAARSAHPYEEPAWDVLALADPPGPTGLGRLGRLPTPVPLAGFAAAVAAALPATRHGVRVAGDPDRRVHRVAVCGGSGDSLLAAAARSGADAYVTADLRHHRVLDHLADGGCPVVDVAHWASEWPWLDQAAALLRAGVAAAGATVEVRVSATCTDPWTQRL